MWHFITKDGSKFSIITHESLIAAIAELLTFGMLKEEDIVSATKE